MNTSDDSQGCWQYAKQNDWQRACQAISVEIEQNPTLGANYCNRGLFFLACGNLTDALQNFEKAHELFQRGDRHSTFLGVVLWWLNQPREAVRVWQNALDAKYLDTVAGVGLPAFLFFAACRLRDVDLENHAVRYLQNVWKPSLAKVWPGPIAGFLLGEMDKDTFLVKQTFKNSTLEARRLSQAHFWVGLHCLRKGDQNSYLSHLKEAVQDPFPARSMLILEKEYWLARAEIEFHSAQSKK